MGIGIKRLLEAECQGRDKRVGFRNVTLKLMEAIKTGKLPYRKVSFKEMAIAFLGQQWYDNLRPDQGGNDFVRSMQVQEAGSVDAIGTTAFSNITGQVIYTAVHDGYQNEEFIGEKLVTIRPTKLSGERIPGHQSISDEALEVKEGMPFPATGFGESFQDLPITKKYGMLLRLTKEAIFFDKTGRLLDDALDLGFRLGMRREKEILSVVIGGTNNYNWRNLTPNTYLAGVLTPGLYINSLGSNELVDWKNIDTMKQLFQDIRNPDSGDPILVGGFEIIVPPFKEWTTRNILNATHIEESRVTGASAPFDEQRRRSANPLPPMTMHTSQLFKDMLVSALGITSTQADKYWFMGNFKRAFTYQENWPISVMTAGEEHPQNFSHDIVRQWRASERGSAAVWDPRYVTRSFDT